MYVPIAAPAPRQTNLSFTRKKKKKNAHSMPLFLVPLSAKKNNEEEKKLVCVSFFVPAGCEYRCADDNCHNREVVHEDKTRSPGLSVPALFSRNSF